MALTKKEKKVSKTYAKAQQKQEKLYDFGDNVLGGSTKPNKYAKVGRQYEKYAGKYADLTGQTREASGLGTFDPTTNVFTGAGGTVNPYGAPTGQPQTGRTPSGAPITVPPLPGQEPTTPSPATPGNAPPPGSAADPNNPLPANVEQTYGAFAAGLPLGININTPEGARAAEVLFPLIQQAFNINQAGKATTTGLQSIEDYKNDPMLQALSAATLEKIKNPYTFGPEQESLLRSSLTDQIATQEKALGDRIAALGARSGIAPDSPLYASLQSQAALQRDLNMADMERKLQLDLAQRRQDDMYRALGFGSQYGGAYQSGLGQRQQNLANIQRGAQLGSIGNPFQGLAESLLAQKELDKSPSTFERYAGEIAAFTALTDAIMPDSVSVGI